MPLAGFTAARGQLSIVLVVLAGTAGSLLGALFWYHVGRRLGLGRLERLAARHGRWLTLSPGSEQTTGLDGTARGRFSWAASSRPCGP
jgi:hypothetical protein